MKDNIFEKYLAGAIILFIATLSSSFLLMYPSSVLAIGDAADQICIASQCTMTPTPGHPLCPMVKCRDVTNGFTTAGFCISPTKCMGTSAAGGGLGMEQLGKALSDILQKLMQGKPPGGSPPPSTPPPTTPTSSGCAQTYTVTAPSSDPCATYVPPVSGSLNTPTSGDTSGSDSSGLGSSVSDLLNSLNGGSFTDTGTTATSSASDLISQITGTTNTQTGQTSQGTTVQFNGNSVTLLPIGASGDIQLLNNGVTVVVGTNDQNTNSAVAGFYGNDTQSGQLPKGLAAQVCQARPWSTNFLSYIIPPSFFDGLCSWRGYQVGTPAATVTQTTQQPIVQTTKPVTTQTSNTKPATTTSQAAPPSVDIWAVPAKVPLGGRTSIFWTSSGATSCSVTSPDGSFTQTALSGGASTVALTGATTFSISCMSADGYHADDFVVVSLSL